MLLKIEQIEKMLEAGSYSTSNGKSVRINEANPRATAAIKKNLWESKEMKHMRERFQKQWKFDFADRSKFPVMEDGFSWNKAAQKCGYADVDHAFKEADSASTFVQLLRAGIQSIVNNMYMTVPTTYESWCKVVNSKLNTELYAPLQGISWLNEVGPQEIYGESRAAGLNLKLKNRKYGTIFAVEKELLEDDTTGQMAQQAGLMGEYCRLCMEVIVYAKMAGKFTGGALATYAGMTIPNTETQPDDEAVYPFAPATTPFVGGGFNRPAAYGVLNQANIQNGFIGLMNQLNMLGLKMQVDPDTIAIGPTYRFDLAVLLNSSFYPSGAAAAGNVGGAFSINPLESIAKAVITRFMFDNTGSVNTNSKRWVILDSKKPFFVSQLRNAAEVTQENPNSGQSFDRDIIRFKVSMRGNADYIDPRFIWQGSDGTA